MKKDKWERCVFQTEDRRRGEVRVARYHVRKIQERIRKIVRYRRKNGTRNNGSKCEDLF